MSVSLRKLFPPQEHVVPEGKMSLASRVYQESAPSRANKSTTALWASFESNNFPQPSQKKTAIGTPHTRCREIHQSGRVAIMLLIRSSPHAGIHFTFLISSSARWRSVLSSTADSMEMNHCSVARKITGLWQRQQCGYECSIFSECSSTPRALSSSMIEAFASNTRLPSYCGSPLRRILDLSTLHVGSILYFWPV